MGGIISIIAAGMAPALSGDKTALTIAIVTSYLAGGFVVFRLASRVLDTRPRIRIACGEGVPNSIGRDRPHYVDLMLNGNTVVRDFAGRVDFFGFTITNLGTETIKECSANLVSLERDGKVLCDQIGGLAFEPRNAGADLMTVDLFHNMPQPLAICSIKDDETVHAGSLGQTWRHEKFGVFFDKPGNYILTVVLSGKNVESSTERFVLKRGSTRTETTISHISDGLRIGVTNAF